MLDNLLKEKVAGSIDIGSRSIRGLSINNKKIGKIVKVPITQSDEESEGLSENAIIALDKMVEELKLKKKTIVVSLPSQWFYTKELKMESIQDEDARLERIEEELGDLIPNYDPLDFLTELILVRRMGNVEELLAISIEREKIEGCLEYFDKRKISVKRIVPDYIASYHVLEEKRNQDFGEEFKGVTAAIDIGLEKTKIFFMDDDGILMHISTPIGGGEFTETIREFKDMDYDEAEEFKMSLEIGEEHDEVEEEHLMFMELTKVLNELEKNIEDSIDYFKNSHTNYILKKIIIFGNGAKLSGLLDRVHRSKRVDTEYIDYSELKMNINLEEISTVEIASLLGNVIEEVV